MRILVTGASGMLGSTLVPTLRKRGHEVFPTDIVKQEGVEYLDIRDFGSLVRLVKRLLPHVVIHLAAKTDIEECEVEVDDAFLSNAVGTQNVALACQEINAVMLYMSTVGVFDGKKQSAYTEFDEPNPINVYGKSKLQGEKFVEKLLDKYFIVRTSWLVGGKEKDKKFVGKIRQQIMDGRSTIYAVTDKVGTPTYIVDLSECIADLIQTNYYGLYHIANKGQATRFDIARKLLQILEREDIKLVPVTSEFFIKEYFAPRPPNESLQSYMLFLRGMNKMRPWDKALREYLQESFKVKTNKEIRKCQRANR